MYRANNCNKAILVGIVDAAPVLDHMLYGERFYSMRLCVPRLSGTMDILPITLPERACGELPQAGDRVRVTGQMRSYNKRVGNGSKLIITVFCHEIDFVTDEDEPRNDIELTGYICKDVIFRTTPFLREICDIIIAVNRSYSKSDYLPCIAWGRNASFARELSVGTRIKITARFQSREYTKRLEDGDSQVRTAYELSCSTLEVE